MNRQAQAAVLFLLGAALLHAGFTDLYLRYVKAGLRPMLLASGVVLIAAALATVWYEWRAQKDGPGDEGEHGNHGEHREDLEHREDGKHVEHREDLEHREDGKHVEHREDLEHREDGKHVEHREESHGQDGHGHAHREPRVAWLLVLPLLALILVAPPALGSYSALRTGTALQQPYGYGNLPAAGPLRLSLVDYAGRAVYDHGRSLRGRQIKVTGFVALDHSGAPYLVRMALNCCAADAQPVKIGLAGRIPPVLQPDAWLEVTGTYTARRTKDPVNHGPIPYFQITAAKPVPVPHDPYDETWNN
ncbi:putative repeat protein (TIGR03943 family) [Streptomyces sp. LBL]|uniref:TIGR03943 family putative permease subunit n=1 Tax=Streptomyces sp. LBL TaxID=2940562 RepID=UPI0024764DAB|nr:TIGR03943 family protein [Streptomyces sp. LBL]MDH6624261.1 putative repeat protein (TIGR03943 family) [Streptomyces sp. LBL]